MRHASFDLAVQLALNKQKDTFFLVKKQSRKRMMEVSKNVSKLIRSHTKSSKFIVFSKNFTTTS